ncbi:MAG: EthD family reductase, partial [Actinobacteria bacterium]|nr:EthD family reductase [Actinomycetota bacterium]
EGATFDHEYYAATHVPMAKAAWGLSDAVIEKGVNGPFVAAVHVQFESMDALGAAMSSEDSAAVLADLPNFTTIAPQMQISEIV